MGRQSNAPGSVDRRPGAAGPPETHGGHSSAKVIPLARVRKRRLLRQLGLRAGDLDSLGRSYLDLYCKCATKLDLLDRFYAEHGLIDDDGVPQASVAFYTSLVNSARNALTKLEKHVQAARPDAVADLHAYLAQRHGDDDA